MPDNLKHCVKFYEKLCLKNEKSLCTRMIFSLFLTARSGQGKAVFKNLAPKRTKKYHLTSRESDKEGLLFSDQIREVLDPNRLPLPNGPP